MHHERTLFEDEFRLAIHQTHNCEAQSVEDLVDVKLASETGTEWEGKVHVFRVSGHPKATRCYAWPEPFGDTAVIIRAVLHCGRVSSAEGAVRSVLRRHAERSRVMKPKMRSRSEQLLPD